MRSTWVLTALAAARARRSRKASVLPAARSCWGVLVNQLAGSRVWGGGRQGSNQLTSRADACDGTVGDRRRKRRPTMTDDRPKRAASLEQPGDVDRLAGQRLARLARQQAKYVDLRHRMAKVDLVQLRDEVREGLNLFEQVLRCLDRVGYVERKNLVTDVDDADPRARVPATALRQTQRRSSTLARPDGALWRRMKRTRTGSTCEYGSNLTCGRSPSPARNATASQPGRVVSHPPQQRPGVEQQVDRQPRAW
jgi:hypothetical protein